MQVQKVQSNQTNFGTRVQMSSETAKRIYGDGKLNKVLKQIKNLEYNGKDDLLSISYFNSLGCYKANLTQFCEGKLLAPARIIPPCRKDRSMLIDINNLIKSYENLCERIEVAHPTNLSQGIEKLFPYIV